MTCQETKIHCRAYLGQRARLFVVDQGRSHIEEERACACLAHQCPRDMLAFEFEA